MSKTYTCSKNIGDVAFNLSTDDADFMQWYLTKDDVTVKNDTAQHVYSSGDYKNYGLSIEKAYERISKGFERSIVTINSDRTASIKVAGYTFTGRV